MSTSPNLQLPYLDANQNQKTVTHNAALTALDALVNCQVQSAALTAPPASPGDGQCWIVGSGSTGAWAGKDLNIAAWQDGAWSFYPPTRGMLAYNDATTALVVWNGTAWASFNSLLALMTITALGIGTAPDTGNPLSATLNNALLNALGTGGGGTGDVRVKLNKSTVGNTASFLYQDAFSGRAEIGLCGDDSFHFKVSPDGSTWTDALRIAAADGSLSIAGAITQSSGDVGHCLAQRAAITALPVPTFQPAANTTANGGTIALDIMPKGTPSPVIEDMVAWIDICNADVAASPTTPTNTLHLSARTGFMEIGTRGVAGATVVPLVFKWHTTEQMRLNSTGINIGTGTANTNAKLQINANSAAPAATTLNGAVALEMVSADSTNFRHLFTTYGSSGVVDFTKYGGTQASPIALTANSFIGFIEWNGYNGTAVATTTAYLSVKSAENWTTSANGTFMSFFVTPVTTTAAVEAVRVNGNGITLGTAGNNINGRLQINGNAASPAASTLNGAVALEIISPDATNFRHLFTTYSSAGIIDFTRYGGTQASPSALTANSFIGFLEWNGYNGTAVATTTAYLSVKSAENWTTSANGTYMSVAVTPVTTTASVEVARFTGTGLNQTVIGATTPAAATVTSLNGGPLAGFRNRLINGNFAINQRAFASGGSLAANAYGFDRWKAGAGGATLTFAVTAPDTTVTITAGTLLQVIEAANIEGGAYTLSWTGTAAARIYQGTASGAYAASPITVTGLASGTGITVDFSTGTLGVVQFEPGSTATPFERRLTGADLALSQRYYRVLNIAGMQGIAASGTTTLFNASFQDMRTAPSITLLKTAFSASIYDMLAGGATWVSSSAMTLSNPASSTVTFSSSITGFSGLTTGQMLFGNNPYPFIGLSAEL